jgi:hypothetical protein
VEKFEIEGENIEEFLGVKVVGASWSKFKRFGRLMRLKGKFGEEKLENQ